MSQVKAMTRAEVIAIGWSGDAELLDLKSNTEYTIRGSAPVNYNHSDYQTRTTADTAIKKAANGGNWNWNARPVILKLKGNLIAASTHTFPHSIPVASPADNIVSPPLTRENEKDSAGKWRIGSHFCLHYIDTITARSAKPGDGSWTDKMYQAVLEAEALGTSMLGGTPADPGSPTLPTESSGDKVSEPQTQTLPELGSNIVNACIAGIPIALILALARGGQVGVAKALGTIPAYKTPVLNGPLPAAFGKMVTGAILAQTSILLLPKFQSQLLDLISGGVPAVVTLPDGTVLQAVVVNGVTRILPGGERPPAGAIVEIPSSGKKFLVVNNPNGVGQVSGAEISPAIVKMPDGTEKSATVVSGITRIGENYSPDNPRPPVGATVEIPGSGTKYLVTEDPDGSGRIFGEKIYPAPDPEASSTTEGSNTLCWPVPSNKKISSPYGMRFHPIDKVNKMHNGIDIGATSGADIVAADSGTVTISEFSNSYGNYVKIDHGNMTTLYAHMSSRKVSKGDSVSKGQVIGLVGSTGKSTGPHLHFEVTENGSRVDPAKFF